MDESTTEEKLKGSPNLLESLRQQVADETTIPKENRISHIINTVLMWETGKHDLLGPDRFNKEASKARIGEAVDLIEDLVKDPSDINHANYKEKILEQWGKSNAARLYGEWRPINNA